MNDRRAAPDLTGCDAEPIHVPGSIQPHGCLVCADPGSLRVLQAAGDTRRLLGIPAAALAGRNLAAVLAPEHVERLRNVMGHGRAMARPVRVFAVPSRGNGPRADVIAHQSSGRLVLEWDPRAESFEDNPLALVQTMIRRVQQADTVQAFCEAVVAEVRDVTGFDRVMIYRFLHDGSGAVIAESIAPGVESFLGLHYPESDIPKQARALYLANWIRWIPDARYAPAPLLPPLDPESGRPLDLSQSVLRSVSPVHRQYLANMGVVASMSMSIIMRGQLWGLIACHHGRARHLPYRLREACELFAEMAASHLETKVAAEVFEARLQSTRIQEELVTRMSQEADLADGLVRSRPNLLDFIPAAGVALWIDGRFTALGETPTAEQVATLVDWLNATAIDGVFATDCLPLIHRPAQAFADRASGMLAISVSRSPRDYVLWFRPEVLRTVTWAGDPNKPQAGEADGAALMPRTSFAAWQESVRLHATPWLDAEVEAAHRLRLSLLEIVLRRIDQLAREREAARLRQEQLTRELDRRLLESREAARALREETARRAVVEAELSQVLRRTVADQEAERLRIARELHDTLGQSLTLLKLGLDGIGRASPDSAQIQQLVAGMRNLTADAGREVNRLAWEIRPVALDDLGLPTAIRNLLDSWSESSGLHFDLHLALDERRLPLDVETTLYRVLQEALTNVVRHAAATKVGVILRRAEDHLAMIVEDDGRGFAPNDPASASAPTLRLGLLGIRERLSLVGGKLEIESAPDHGTTLFIRVSV